MSPRGHTFRSALVSQSLAFCHGIRLSHCIIDCQAKIIHRKNRINGLENLLHELAGIYPSAEAKQAVTEATKEEERSLEEDDLFEEFAKEEVADDGAHPNSLWAPEWEDEELGDDFASRLRAELAK
eukprot:scaffold159014_cov32-Prasinocladus_malaysianus.AAC.1